MKISTKWRIIIVWSIIIPLAFLLGCSHQPQQYDREWKMHQQMYYQLMGWETEKPEKVISCTFGAENEAAANYCAFVNFGDEGVSFLKERKKACEICSFQTLMTVQEWRMCVEVCRQ